VVFRQRRLWLVAVAAAQIAFGHAPAARAEQPAPIAFERIMEHVRVLTEEIGPRPMGSEGARRAARYIEQCLEEIGLDVTSFPVGTVDAPAITVLGSTLLPAVRVSTDDPNLLVRFPAAAEDTDEEAILVMAHYDSMATTPGAVDNATAVGILIEVARRLADSAPRRPVILAWPAAEETRWAGARVIAEHLEGEVGLAIALDLVGQPGEATLNGLGPLLGKAWLEWLAAAARRSRVPVSAPIPHRVISRHFPQIERSDHGAFTERGVPAFHIYNRGPERIFLPYHGPLDTANRVDERATMDVTRFLLAILSSDGPLPEAGGDPGFWIPFPGGPFVISTLALVLLEALLALAAVAGLAELVHTSDSTPRERGFGLSAALVIYPLVWIVVFVAMRVAESVSDHPAPWVHAPLRFEAALVAIAGSLGVLAAWLYTRWRRAPGQSRYLAFAIVLPLLVGLTCIAVGAPEIAWTTLWISAAFGGLAWTRSLRSALPVFGLSLFPLVGALAPAFLREAVFNGFWRSGMPLTGYLAVLLLPHTFALIYLCRRFGGPLPHRGRAARLAVAIPIVLIVAAALWLVVPGPRCSGPAFERQGLACELH